MWRQFKGPDAEGETLAKTIEKKNVRKNANKLNKQN